MQTKSKSLHFYTNLFSNWDYLKDSGILTNERINEIKDYCAEDKFVPAILQDGRTLVDLQVHSPSGKVFMNSVIKDAPHLLYEKILCDFLTDDEIERLNKDANDRYLEVKEQKDFEKAEKIKASEYHGGVFWGDEFYPSVSDYLDYVSDSQQYDEEHKSPLYLWAAREVPSCRIFFDDMIENATQEAHEDFDTDELYGLKELYNAVNLFNAKNSKVLTYWEDRKRAIILD